MVENCQSEVIEIIERALQLEKGSLNEASCADTMDAWDSLGQLSILVALNKHFEGKISSISEMAEADSISKILNILKESEIC